MLTTWTDSSRNTLACGAAAILIAVCASSGTQRSGAAADEGGLRSLIAAERAFARHSERAGIKESFVANLGADGILFRPGPVNGLEWFRDRPPTPGYLSWEPEVAVIAASGDLGYTTGPWEFRARGVSDTVSGAGHYVSVWRRDTIGVWKMAIDIGTSHRGVARPADAPGTVIASVGSLGADAKRHLLARDSLLGVGGTRGAPQSEALLGVMAEEARLHREGALPTLGIEAVRGVLPGDDRPYHSKPLGGGTSRDEGFGYTYGEYELVATFTRPAERGFFCDYGGTALTALGVSS